MSDNDFLPPELTDLETQLRRLPLPAAKLSREATLYQCGWAAAEAHFRSAHSRSGWIWMSSSAALAASVLVLSVLLVKQEATPEVAEMRATATAVDPTPLEDAVIDHAPAPRPIAQAKPLPFFDFAVRFAPDDRSLLAVRDRALRGDLPEISHSADQGDVSHRRPKTSRELLNEFIERNIHS